MDELKPLSRLINEADVIEQIDDWLSSVGYCTIAKGLSYYAELMGCIQDAPTVDAVEVVRCKDCKYWDKEEYAEGNLHVCNCPIKDWATDDTRHHIFVTLYKPEDYCSYGERKEVNDG